MVTGLHLPFQPSPLDGRSAKSQSVDSAMFPSLSFGEILRAKEKQLQQEQGVNPTSIAAALANLQALLMAKPSIPEIETSDNTANTDTQLGVQTHIMSPASSQVNPSIPSDGLLQSTGNTMAIIDQPAVTLTESERIVTTKLPGSVSDLSRTIQSESPEEISVQSIIEEPKVTAANFTKPEIPINKNSEKNEAENVAQPTFQAPGTTRDSRSSLFFTSLPSLAEAKTIKSEGDPISQPGEGSNFQTDEAVSIEKNVENTLERPILASVSQVEVLERTPSLSSSVQVEFNQKTLPLVPEQAESFVNALSSNLATPQESLVQDSFTARDRVTIPFTSQQEQNFINPFSTKTEVTDTALVSSSFIQSGENQKSNPFTVDEVETTDTPLVQNSVDQSTTPKASAFAPQQVINREPPTTSEAPNTNSSHPLVVETDASNEISSFSFEQLGGEVHTSTTTQISSAPSEFVHKPVLDPSEQIENIIDTSVPPTGISDEAPVQNPSLVKDEATTSIHFEQAEKPRNSAASTIQAEDSTSVQHFPVRDVASQEPDSLTSEQAERFVNTSSSVIEASEPASEPAPAQHPFTQPEISRETTRSISQQFEHLANPNISRFSVLSSALVQPSLNQVEPEQQTTPFPSEQANEFVNRPVFEVSNGTLLQHSVDQSATAATNVAGQEAIPPDMFPVEMKELSVDFEIPNSSLTSSSQGIELKLENVTTPTVRQTEVPIIKPIESTDDFSSAQDEVEKHDHVIETKPLEIKTNGSAASPFSPFTTEPDQNAETGQTESTQLQHGDELHQVTVDTGVDYRVERPASPPPLQTTTTATFTRSMITHAPLQTEPIDVNFDAGKTTAPAMPDETLQPAASPKSADRVVESAQIDRTEKQVQTPLSEVSSSVIDANNSPEIDKISQPPVSAPEMVAGLRVQDLSEIPLSNSTEVSGRIPEAKATEIDNDSTPMPVFSPAVNESENIEESVVSKETAVLSTSNADRTTEKFVDSPASHPETIAVNLTERASNESPDLSAANQALTSEQMVMTTSDVEDSEPAAKVSTETKSLYPNATNTSNEARQATSQSSILKEAKETSNVEERSGFQPASHLKTAEEAANNLEQVDRLNENLVIPAEKPSVTEAERVNKITPSEKPLISSAANIASFEHVTETLGISSSTKSDLFSVDSIEPSQDLTFGQLVDSEQTMTETGVSGQAVDFAQPEVSATDYAHPSQIQVLGSTSEEPGFQQGEMVPSFQPAPQPNSVGSNAKSENPLKIIGTQSVVSFTEETNSVPNPAMPDTLVTSEVEEFAADSSIARPETHTPSIEIPQSEVENYGVAKDVPFIETTNRVGKTFISKINKNEHLTFPDQALYLQQSSLQNDELDGNRRSENDVEIIGANTPDYSVQAMAATNRPTAETVNIPVSTGAKETTATSTVFPQGNANISSIENSQPAIEFLSSMEEQPAGNVSMVSNDTEAEAIANTEAAVENQDQSFINGGSVPVSVGHGESRAQQETGKSQAETDTLSLETLQPALELSRLEENTLTAEAVIDSNVRTQTDSDKKEINVDLDSSANGVKTSIYTEPEDITTETKIAQPQQSVNKSTTETQQSTIDASAAREELSLEQAEVEALEVETRLVDHSKKITISQDKSELAIHQFSRETVVSETNMVIAQEGKNNASPDNQRSTTESKEQLTAQQDQGQEVPLRTTDDVMMTQAMAEQKEIAFEPRSTEPNVKTSKPIDVPHSPFAVPAQTITVPEMSVDDAKAKDQITRSVKQNIAPQGPSTEVHFVKPTLEAVEAKNTQKQVSVNVSETELETNVAQINNESLLVETDGKLNHGSTSIVNEAEILTNQTPLSTANDIATPSPQSKAPMKVETGKQESKTKPVLSKDEETLPPVKQTKQSQAVESAAVATGPSNDALFTEVNGKVPVDNANVQAAEIARQVIHQMNPKIKNGLTSMHLQLNPHELGKIDVEMVSTSQGVQVTFFAEQSNTGKLLETQLNQLRESLIDSGVQLSGLNISQHGLSEQKGGFFSQDKNFTQPSQGDIVWSESNSRETPPVERSSGHLGEVDYRI